MTVFKSIFPYNQTIIAEYPLMNETTINNCVSSADKAFQQWSTQSFAQRSDVLKNVAIILRRDKDKYAALITNEMGKIIKEAKAETEKCAWACEYYADHAEQLLKDEIVEADFYKSFVAYEPLGAVLAVMPWNFPFWQVFRFAAPTLMAGNVALLKHAPNVCGCAIAIEKLFLEAGAAQGVFQTLIIDVPDLPKIVEANIVHAVTLTGSERAGSSFASLAAKNIKKSVLELGGSDALIVLPDADMEKAAAVAVQSRMQNAGQSCIAAKRFIVVENAMNDFLNETEKQIRKLKQGNPFEEGITTGPMARLDLAQTLQNQLQRSVEKGASLQIGGNVDRCNFQPSLLLNVQKGMPAFDEETFGPLAAIITVKDEEEAVQLANQSRYGLSSSIWTKDVEKGIALARKIAAGSVYINTLVRSDPRLPFGGVKKSGYGRELAQQGVHEFVNVKTIAADL